MNCLPKEETTYINSCTQTPKFANDIADDMSYSTSEYEYESDTDTDYSQCDHSSNGKIPLCFDDDASLHSLDSFEWRNSTQTSSSANESSTNQTMNSDYYDKELYEVTDSPSQQSDEHSDEQSHDLNKKSSSNQIDYNNFVTHCEEEDDYFDNESIEDIYYDSTNQESQNENHNLGSCMPSTHAGEFAYEIEDKTPQGQQHISGHVILNQCGSLLTRRGKYKMRGWNSQRHFLQRICATTMGDSIPLLYPEGMIFPSIFYANAPDDSSILGAIPSSLLNDSNKNQHWFATVMEQSRSRLTSVSIATSTNPRYCCYCYDKAVNLTANHQDVRIVLNRGLTVDPQSPNKISVRSKNDSSMFESIDRKQMVKNLCSSQRYHKMDFFLTFTCKQKDHFGTKRIRSWIDEGLWKKNYPNFNKLTPNQQDEITAAMEQSAAGLLLRNWLETRKLFLNYLLRSTSSAFKSVGDIFARDEYQMDQGNLPHIHALLKLDGKT